MNNVRDPSSGSKWRRSWVAVVAGAVAQVGVSTLLVGAAILLANVWSAAADSPFPNWAHRMDVPGHVGWYVLQGISLVSGLAAGVVAVLLSPPRSRVAIAVLLVLSLVSVLFAQLPQPRSVGVVAIWAAATPVGILLGALLGRRYERVA